MSTKKRMAFTLVELLIVVVFIGIFAGFMALVAGRGSDNAEATKIVSNLRTLKTAAILYYTDNVGMDLEEGVNHIKLLNSYLDKDLAFNAIESSAVRNAASFVFATPVYAAAVEGYYFEVVGGGWYVYYKFPSDMGGVKKKLAEMAAATGLENQDGAEFSANDPLVAMVVRKGSGGTLGDSGDGSGEEMDAPAWDVDTVYLQGDRASYNGSVYEAWYWTKGTVPGVLGSPWQEITDEWRDFNKYSGDDIVEYDGRLFKAWYDMYPTVGNPGPTPGVVGNPWQEITSEWRGFNKYSSGDIVEYNGKMYKAKWDIYPATGSSAPVPGTGSTPWDNPWEEI